MTEEKEPVAEETSTETKTNTEAETPKKKSLLLPSVLAIAVIALIGYFAMTQGGLDQKAAEAVVDGWTSQFNEGNEKQNIRYERLEVTGEKENRHIIIYNPTLTNHHEDDDGLGTEFELSTAKISLHPQSVAFDAFKAEIVDPIVIREDDEEITITSPTPLIFDYTVYLEDGMALTRVEHLMPEDVLLENPSEESKVLITLEEGGRISAVSAMDYRARLDLQINASDIRLVEEGKPEHPLTIASISLNSNTRDFDKANGALRAQIDVADIFSVEEDMPYGAISIIGDLDYSGPIPKDGQEIDWAQEKALVDLRQLRISAADTSVEAALNFQTGTGDLLPVGTGQVDVTNFAFIRDELREEGLLEEAEETLVNALLLRIAGSKMDELQDLTIPIKREDAGSLTIGNATFEELFAIFLTGGKLVKPADTPLTPHDTPPLDVQEEATEELSDEQ